MTIRDRIRLFAKSNPIAYRMWFSRYQSTKKPSSKLPEFDDHLYLDGYPRSGNAYFTAALKKIVPELKFANHLHVVAPIKIALQNQTPTFVLIRNPEAAIASYILHIESAITESSKSERERYELCSLLVEEWLAYYTFVHRFRTNIYIIAAEFAFKKPLLTVDTILDLLDYTRGRPIGQKWEQFHEDFKSRDSTKPQGSTSFPSEAREQQKLSIIKMLRGMSQLQDCQSIYKELSEYSIVTL